MDRRLLGPDGPEISVVGLGCNNFGGRLDLAATRGVVDAAVEFGIDFFDTADIYGGGGGSERLLGEVLRGRRDRVVLATKFGNDMGDANPAPGSAPGSRAYLRVAFEGSLARLETDYVDLLYYHRPDGRTPFEETLGAMAELVTEGKVRQLGVSNLTLAQLDEAARVSPLPIAALQNEYSLLHREAERDVLPRCRELDIAFIPYFPLASGLLTGKYRRGEAPPENARLATRPGALSDETFERVDALTRYARGHGHDLLELAFGALLSEPGIPSVIAGATSPEQVRANVEASGWRLSPAELEGLPA